MGKILSGIASLIPKGYLLGEDPSDPEVICREVGWLNRIRKLTNMISIDLL